jgi:GNAT superfamily N-acetyltransferase
MQVRVRRARLTDAAAILEMANALNRYEGKPPTPLTAEGVARHMLGPRRVLSCVLAELDGAVVGYAAFQPSFDMETGSKGLYMSDLFVKEAARGRGIGRALMEWLAREALRRGRRVARLGGDEVECRGAGLLPRGRRWARGGGNLLRRLRPFAGPFRPGRTSVEPVGGAAPQAWRLRRLAYMAVSPRTGCAAAAGSDAAGTRRRSSARRR